MENCIETNELLSIYDKKQECVENIYYGKYFEKLKKTHNFENFITLLNREQDFLRHLRRKKKNSYESDLLLKALENFNNELANLEKNFQISKNSIKDILDYEVCVGLGVLE